ncbi:MAG: hypothetical protein ACERKZ_21320 [Lachnotalea sp.]
MKKKRRVVILCITILLLTILTYNVYIIKTTLVTMSRSVSNGEQVANGSGFTIDKAKEVVVKYKSSIEDGDLTIRLTDENWNTIQQFQTNKEGKENLYLEKGGYFIRVESEYFKGSYHLKVQD